MARILVIDDTKNIKMLITKALTSEEWTIDCAGSGEEGLKLFYENKYDVILLDIRMPNMSGTEVLKRLKEREPGITVIIITAYPTVKNAVECIKLGAVDYLRKPFTPEKIRTIVKELLDREEMKSPNNDSYLSLLAFAKKCINKKDLEEAINHLRKAVSINMEDGESFNLLGYIWEIKGDFTKAHRYYSIASQLDPLNDEFTENIKRISEMI